MTAEARGPFPVVPLSPDTEEWVAAYVASVLEVDPTADPDKAQAAMREAMTVPRPRASDPDDSGFERPDADMGRSQDDDEQADRAADREWAARWER